MRWNGLGAMDTAEPAIAVIAAEARELAGLVAHATAVTALPWGVRYALEAQISGARWILVAHGAGTALAREAAEAALRQGGKVAAVVSTGLCGGLDPALGAGDVVVATTVRTEDGEWSAAAPVRSPGARLAGPVFCSTRVASTPEEKAALRERGAVAVEMESAGVAAAAQAAGVPFFCIKGVSDTAEESLPLDFNRYRDPEGRFRPGRIAAAALARPVKIPSLARLARVSRQTSIHLGDFLAACHF